MFLGAELNMLGDDVAAEALTGLQTVTRVNDSLHSAS